ncbi:MAG: murein biosynthesis integral membrane protein MurJ [Gammaproteobacteria bacterium]|nr:MAG: murein biosynthesis integral membrane protein MurJ [Gammaproteobacteria bacterium]
MPTANIPAGAAAATAAEPGAERLNTRAAGVVGLAVLCSRVLGLAREQIFAALFGGGRVMDAFTIAFRIPNLLRDLFAEGALSTAFVTVFSRTAALQDTAAAWRLADKVATLTAVSLSAITVTLTRIMYPFILLVSLAALVMGMLNARNVFGMPAMASSFFNLGSIVSGVLLGYWLDPHFGARAILGLAIGTLVGGTLQLVVQLPALRRAGHSFHPDFHWRDPGVRSILRLMGPSVIAASTTQLNVLVNSVFASQLGDGPTFWLTVAFRLMQLPLGIFGVALGTVALPLLARMAATGNTEAFRSELARGMRLTFLMTIPSSIGLMVLAEPIISVLYQHGRFGAHETAESAAALRLYAIGLCGYAALKVLVNAFYALERRRTPMLVSFLAVGLNLALNWTLTVRFNWGHRGLALSTACVATTNFLILYALMRSHLGRLESRAMLALLSKVALASAVLLLASWAGAHFLLADWAVQSFWPKCLSLALVIVLAAAAFFVSASALGIAGLQRARIGADISIPGSLRRGTPRAVVHRRRRQHHARADRQRFRQRLDLRHRRDPPSRCARPVRAQVRSDLQPLRRHQPVPRAQRSRDRDPDRLRHDADRERLCRRRTGSAVQFLGALLRDRRGRARLAPHRAHPERLLLRPVLLHTRLRCQHAGGEHRRHALRLARRGRSELPAPPRPVVVRGGALRAHRDAAAHRVHSDPLRVPVLGCRRRKRNARCEDARP